MRSYLALPNQRFSPAVFSAKVLLFAIVASACFFNSLYAGANPASKHKGNYAAKLSAKRLRLSLKRVAAFPPPSLSYGGAQVYVKGTAVTPLVPVSSGVSAAGYSNGLINFATGFTNPRGITIDSQGNCYIADFGAKKVFKIPVGGGTPVSVGTGFFAPVGVATDFAGNLYVADYGQNSVIKIPVNGGSQVSIGGGYNGLLGIAADAKGNVYAPDYNNGLIYKIPAGGGAQTVLATGFTNPSGVAVDSLGNVYVADYTTSLITKISPAGTKTNLGSGFHNPYGLTVDAAGNVFVADYNHDAVVEIPVGGGSPIALNSSFNTVTGVAVDAAGNVLVTDFENTTVSKIAPVGGYYISAPLPAGLNFANATGIISGTPTAASLATNYVVTAYNSSGNTSAAINITINGAPKISFASPQSYVVGVTISPLSPVSSGVYPVGFNDTPVVAATGFHQPFAVTTDVAGNIWVADRGFGSVYKIPAGGGMPVAFTGFNLPSGIAVDKNGNVYVGDAGSNSVKVIPAGGGATYSIGSGFSGPAGVVVDAAGNVFVCDELNGLLKEIPVGGGATITIASGFYGPFGLAIDAAGNLYVADSAHYKIKKVRMPGAIISILGTGFVDPFGVAVDPEGNVYVADSGNHVVKMIPAGSTTPVIIGSGFSAPVGLAVDAAGDVIVADEFDPAVKLITPSGGYFISTSLPLGLAFNGTTGIISGKAAAVSPATNYTVTAYNSAGGTPATVNIKVNPFSLHYPSPDIFTKNVAITPLTPTVTGGAVAAPAYSNTMTGIGSGFSTPRGLAADAAGNIYIADYSANKVYKMPAGGGAPMSIGSGFSGPDGVAVDAASNVYVSDYSDNTIKEIPAGGGATFVFSSAIAHPYGLASDAAGNIYVADNANLSIKKIPAGGGTPVVVRAGFNGPLGVAVDATGNIYVGDSGTGAIKEIPADGSATVFIGSGFSNAYGVTIDAEGDIFVADAGNTAAKEIPAGGGTPILLNNVFGLPTGITTDGAGNVYVADYQNSAVKKITPLGGYYISPFLPDGLSFSNTSGTISGTPIAASPPTVCTITAYNGASGNSTTANIQVISNANLSALTLSSGTLSPAFAAGKLSYTASVANGVTSVTATPTVGNAGATVTVNGLAVTSGSPSGAITLNVGPNTLTVVVTSQDGQTKKTYTVTVTRLPSSNANLSSLKLSSGTLSPTFAGTAITDYTAAVGNTITSVTVTPTVAQANATIMVNSVAVTSGSPSGAIALSVGANSITTLVTAQDGITTQTYTVTVTRAPSTNDNLSALHLSTGTLSPSFAGATITSYTASVANTVTSVTITPTSAQTTSTVTINGAAVTSGTASGAIALSVGDNIINTVVTAQDGTTTKTYTVTVTRAPSANDNLSALHLSIGTLSPAFAGATITSYTASVGNTTASITITPTTAQTTSTVTVNGAPVASGTASGPIAMSVGDNIINTVVTAEDGTTTKTYTVTVTRAPSTNDNLSGLHLSNCVLSPVFAGATTTSYTTSVASAISSITVTPTTAQTTSAVTVNGITVASGTASGAIALAAGPNTVTTIVTAQDGITTKTYTVTVTRGAGPANIPDESLSVERSLPNPQVGGDDIRVHPGVSPNGDGFNDFLVIDGITSYPDNKLTIMNRSGAVVFEAKGYDNSSKTFNGHSDKTGSMQRPGTYFYSLDYTANGVLKHKTGFIVLKY